MCYHKSIDAIAIIMDGYHLASVIGSDDDDTSVQGMQLMPARLALRG